MPFCPNCGKQTEPGENYCAGCGILLKPSDIPPPPPPGLREVPPAVVPAPEVPGEQVPPPGTPAGTLPGMPPVAPGPGRAPGRVPLSGNVLAVIAVAAVVLIVAAAYVTGIAGLPGFAGTGPVLQVTPAPTLPATTAPADTPAPALTETTLPPTPAMTVEARYEETYEQIYGSNRTYLFGEKVTVPHTLTRPPLYIKFNVTPAMVNETKISLIGDSEVFAIYPDPVAWFEVKVLTAAGGTVVDSRGFGVSKGYSGITRQEFMIRTAGDYIVEISGNRVTTTVEIRIGTS